MKIHPDFDAFVKALNDNNVEYVIIGAYALAFLGHPRATGDIDFWVHPQKDNALKLLTALNDFGFGTLNLTVDDILSGKIIQLGFPPVRIDLVTKLDGLDSGEILHSKMPGKLGTQDVWYLSKHAFIKNKRSSGRHKDLADIELLGEKVEE